MKGKKQIRLLIIILFHSLCLYAIPEPEDTIVITKEDQNQIADQLDSLLNIWYIKNSFISFSDSNITMDKDTAIEPMLSDSVYIERLARLPGMIPLPYNDIVKSFIGLYTVKRRVQVQAMLSLSEYYFPLFEQALDAEGLPLELKYLPVIESALNPIAVSRAGATGIWQFMYTTGKLYKLKITSYVDERRDPVKATNAAVKFLKDLYVIYNDWTLVIAAYNCGPGNVNKAIRRCKGETDFWKLYFRMPRETRGYVPAFIAASYVMNYYKEHNITPLRIKIPSDADTLIINDELHLKQVSEVLNIPIDLIRELNPQYKKDIIPANESNPLRIPSANISRFIELQDSIFAYKDSLFFNPNNTRIKEVHYSPSHTHITSASGLKKINYTVKNGDNLGYISTKYHVSIADLRYWNNLRGNMIRVGQKLTIYVPSEKTPSFNESNTASSRTKQTTDQKNSINTPSDSYSQNTIGEDDDQYIYYTVKSGDNLWTIAQKYPGVSNDDILKLNGITNARKLQPGQKLKIKRKRDSK